MFDEDVNFSAFAILLVVGELLWMFISQYWVGRGMDLGWIMRIIVHLAIVPMTYLIAYIMANKD